MIRLTRRYRFCASHRLHSDLLSKCENERVYGKCNNPFGHGHDYALEVTVGGPLDPLTGLLVAVSHLDRLVADCVLSRFDHRNINLDLAEFSDLVPTTENIALVIADLLQQGWRHYVYPASAQLVRIYIEETDRNSFEVMLPVVAGSPSDARSLEGIVTVHA